MLKKEMPRCRETDVFIHLLFKNNPEGFVINGEHRFEKGEGWNMARYIGRYVKHPPIAESRIMVFDGKKVTFWYKDSETKQRKTVTMEKLSSFDYFLAIYQKKILKL